MTSITADQLRAIRDRNDDFLLVNTLAPEHFDKTKIPGAINIPQDQDDFAKRVKKEAGGKDATIVVYCASAECDSSTAAAQKLEQAGFKKVFDFEGGYKAWQQHEASAPAHASASAR